MARTTPGGDGREEPKKQVDHKEIKESPDREEKKLEQKVTAVTAKRGETSSISLEGNSEVDITLKMMTEHCKKWESSQQYKAEGMKLLGMRRHAAATFDTGKLEKGTIVCHAPSQGEAKFIWTFDYEKAKRNIPDRNSPFSNSCYGYIFKTVEVMSRNTKQMNRCNNTQVAAADELPDNIGESLLHKMKEVSDQRKQKKKERMKAKYKRKTAGPGYNRGKISEGKAKVPNRAATHEPSASPQNSNLGHCKVRSEKYMPSPFSLQETGTGRKSSAHSFAEPYRDGCHSSSDDNFPTRAAQRKAKTRTNPQNPSSEHDRVRNANRNIDKGMKVNSKVFFSTEGDTKIKHKPSLTQTLTFVASSSDREVVTVSSNASMNNQGNAGGRPKKQPHVIAQPTLTTEK